MNILGRDISEKTAAELERIYDHIGHTVEYVKITPNDQIGFGRADWTADPCWKVYSVTNLSLHYFEVNLLHEHYHLCQYVDGFPMTTTKELSNTSISDYATIRSLGGHISSVILDLDVCDRIDELGLDSNFFFEARYQQAMKYDFRLHGTYRPEDILVTVSVAGIILQNTKKQIKHVLKHCQEQNAALAERAVALANLIREHDHRTPFGCFKCLVAVYDYLNVWRWQEIEFYGHVFASHEDASTFLASYCLNSK